MLFTDGNELMGLSMWYLLVGWARLTTFMNASKPNSRLVNKDQRFFRAKAKSRKYLDVLTLRWMLIEGYCAAGPPSVEVPCFTDLTNRRRMDVFLLFNPGSLDKATEPYAPGRSGTLRNMTRQTRDTARWKIVMWQTTRRAGSSEL
jgi:hypothetical protein